MLIMSILLLKTFILIFGVPCLFERLVDSYDKDESWKNENIENEIKNEYNLTSTFLNFGKKVSNNDRHWFERFESNDEVFRRKADILSRLLKIHIDSLRNETDQIEVVFLVDASGSIGADNFRSELSFVRKLLADFTVEPLATRVAVVTFAGKRNVNRNVDQISSMKKNVHKCYLLNKQLNNISYSGGGTYTRGALLEALEILQNSRETAKKVVFLITDGFSNGGDPRPAANLLKKAGVVVFTFGIRTGNIEELHDIASFPGYTHSYLLDSFAEFEALARRALHRDLKTGKYMPVEYSNDCDILCSEYTRNETEWTCCDDLATCSCGIATGHYACICAKGYFGSGFKGFCQPCPNGTYASEYISGDSTSSCAPCPDVNHITIKMPAMSVTDCVCAFGFITDGKKCEVITCPKLKIPRNGYLVKASACSNVVNAACGIRCRIGYYLTGDSIRLCGKDGTWSGNEPECLLKTCPLLRAPMYGRIRCQYDDFHHHQVQEDSVTYPIDTRCQFKCDVGYQLRGSKVRNCLPLSRWDGLKATCKAIKCEPLKPIASGTILPGNCTGPNKVLFATNCTITCKKGFKLTGPRSRLCGGRNGVWSQRHSVNQCIDETPPSIKCPADITLKNIPGANYAYVNWEIPYVFDNSDESPAIWSKPYITFPWKVKIGTRSVVYIAQDASGNKARCKFKVKVLDNEPPMIENCIDPPVIFSGINIEINNITWDEPGFYDNSKLPVRVMQSHRPVESVFPLGKTKVIYNATDVYGNIAICILNITIEDACTNITAPTNGYSKCISSDGQDSKCLITCKNGYGLIHDTSRFEVEHSNFSIKCDSLNKTWGNDDIPDCSELEISKGIYQEGNIVLEGNASIVCDNLTTLRELSGHIIEDLRLKLLDMCGNDIDCNLISFDPECQDELFTSESVYPSPIRRRRNKFTDNHFRQILRTKRTVSTFKDLNNNKTKVKKQKEKIEIKFKFIGKIINENFENPKQGLQKLREKISSMIRSGKLDLHNNRTNYEIAKLALNLHVIFGEIQELCEPGSVLRKHSCVKCPLGTFHDFSTAQCQPCPFGKYQNVSGSTECRSCPDYTFTKKMRAKSLQDCIHTCRPGYYSRRKRYHGAVVALEPCLTCDIGFYQSKYGQTDCLPCPNNTTTSDRASTRASDCLEINMLENDICKTIPCLNAGLCTQEEDGFSCECPNHYVGSKCEKFQNPCDSSPCLNDGYCTLKNNTDVVPLYTCFCKNDYTGQHCEVYVDECTVNPCKNGGQCVSMENDYMCACKDGFEGIFCEIPINYCNPSPCEEGSTCITANQTWQCLCAPGFLGPRCNLMPCDWLPCQGNSICINLKDENATKESYRCDCLTGYTGENCTLEIDYCENSPCLNHGRCYNKEYNYACVCPPSFTGNRCETELMTDYIMYFTKSGTTDYILTKGPAKDLDELTICLWLRSIDTFNYGTILSYATIYHDNAFTITDYNGLVLYVNGQGIVTDIKVNDGFWHFLCITWKSEDGAWQIFLDGMLKDSGVHLAKDLMIHGNGSLVIGQEQDHLGGGFSESESFLGKLTLLDIWDVVLLEMNIAELLSTCEKYHGSLFTWSQMQEYMHGNIVILTSPFCRGCPLPVIPFKGKINVSEDLSEVIYYCESGYILRYGNKEYQYLKRKCLKQGQWEGQYTPVCSKIKCGFPGYFPRGHIYGWSYTFGDKIEYFCTDGYQLRGNSRRICKSDGKWSGVPPICIGMTCKNLLAPENGDVEYIIDEHERDDITIIQAGQQLEFKCNPGFQLIGNKLLTCLGTGIWDYGKPICTLYECSSPKMIEHGYAVLTNSNENNRTAKLKINITPENLTTRSYFYGDTLEYFCHVGYKFEGNNNLWNKLKLECSINGSWIGSLYSCINMTCPWPNTVNKGKLFLMSLENKTIEVYEKFKVSPEMPETVYSLNEERDLMQSFVPDSQILTICNPGYEIMGESIRTCTNEGNWSSETPSCQPHKCSITNESMFGFLNNTWNETFPTNHTNIIPFEFHEIWNESKHIKGIYGNLIFVAEGNSYNDRITIVCRIGTSMRLNGLKINEVLSNLTWICKEKSEWKLLNLLNFNDEFLRLNNNSLDNICQEVACMIPKTSEHEYVVVGNSSKGTDGLMDVNDVISFKCDEGYILEGNKVSTCLANGTWSALPSCKPVTCKNPPILTNAILKWNGTKPVKYSFNDVIFYECIPGYQIFGPANAVCLSNGKWSRLNGRCSKISCGKPILPAGIIVYGRSYLYQDQLTYSCSNGKRMGLITCLSNGQWSNGLICTVNN